MFPVRLIDEIVGYSTQGNNLIFCIKMSIKLSEGLQVEVLLILANYSSCGFYLTITVKGLAIKVPKKNIDISYPDK